MRNSEKMTDEEQTPEDNALDQVSATKTEAVSNYLNRFNNTEFTNIAVASSSGDEWEALLGSELEGIRSYVKEEINGLREEVGESKVGKLQDEIEGLREEFNHLKSCQLSSSISKSALEDDKEDAAETHGHASLVSQQEKAPNDYLEGQESDVECETETMPEDTFSFFVVSKYWTHSFLTSTAIFLVQIATYILLLINTIDRTNYKNPMQIPANVSVAVRGTQMIAILITVLTQDDIRTGLSQINRGYVPAVVEIVFPEASFWKWVLSVSFRCIEGSLGIVVTFLLIVTAETVLDLLLNFTAMEFVSQLDEICFSLAKDGFLGKPNQEQAVKVSDSEIKMPIKKGFKLPPIVLLIFTMIGMMAGWGIVAAKQTSGQYLCKTLMVQFGDDVDANIGAFSGLYDRLEETTGFFEGEKVVYVERLSRRAMFGYCDSLKAWTFSYEVDKSDLDPCKWRAKSSKTLSYDLEVTVGSDWFIKNEDDALLILEPFFIQCYDCHTNEESNRAQCGNQGYCENAVCECNEDWFGSRCEFRQPCKYIEIDERFDGFLGTRTWSTKYEALKTNGNKTVAAYGRPVYVSQTQPGQSGQPGHFDIILFTGRRWIATYTELLEDYKPFNDHTRTGLGNYFQNDFHAFFSFYQQAFISQPMDKLTPLDLATPIGLLWYNAKPKDPAVSGLQTADVIAGALSVSCICSICNDDSNPCQYEGLCSVDRKCQCSHGASGTLCQITPNGNAVCDHFFNTPAFGHDGGDCCESTCLTNKKATCGKDSTGYIHFGYPDCHVKSDDWVIKGDTFKNTEFGEPPYSVALSYNGNTIAVGEPNLDRVHLFDKDGLEWVPRGPFIEGPAGTRFGFRVQLALFESDPIQVNNPLVKTKLRLLIHTNDDQSFTQNTYLYECGSTRCAINQDFLPNDMYSFATISSYGETLAYSIIDDINSYPPQGNRLIVQELDGRGYNFSTSPRYQHINYAVSLSAPGNVLAVRVGLKGIESPDLYTDVKRVYKLENWVEDYTKNQKNLDNFNRISSYNWIQLGEDIVDILNVTELDIFMLRNKGKTLSLSADGTVMAVGMPHRNDHPGVYVFELQASGWTQRGEVITGEKSFGFQVDLSADGNILLAGTGGKGMGEVQTYRWVNSSWVAFEQLFEGDESVLSADGLTMAIGGKQLPSVFHRPKYCPGDYGLFTFSLFIDSFRESSGDVPRGTSFRKDYQLRVFSQADDGHVSLEYLFEHFRSGAQSTLEDNKCFPRNECLLFYITDTNPEEDASNVRYNIFDGGIEIAEVNAGSSPDLVFYGKCLECPHNNRRARLVSESESPFDWYVRDSEGNVASYGSTLDEMIDESSRNWRYGAKQKWYMMWKDICLPENTCIEVGLRNRLIPNPVKFDVATMAERVRYFPPVLIVGDEKIMLNKIYNSTDYGEIFVYNSCQERFTLSNDTSYFKDDFDVLVKDETMSDSTESPTHQDLDQTTPSNDGISDEQRKIIDDPCDPKKNPTIFIKDAVEFCDKQLFPSTNYVLTKDIMCVDGNGAILSTQTCLNCQGFSLTSHNVALRDGNWDDTNPYVGLRIPPNSSESTIYNCAVENFDIGVEVHGSNSKVIHSDIIYSKMYGIQSSAQKSTFHCSSISHSYLKGIIVRLEDLHDQTVVDLSYSLVEGNDVGLYFYEDVHYHQQFRATQTFTNVDCSIIRNNLRAGIFTDSILTITDAVVSNNGKFNVGKEIGILSVQRVTACGGRNDFESDTYGEAIFDVVQWADVTCDAAVIQYEQELYCNSSCSGSCKESATCPDYESILPTGCDEKCTRPGRFVPESLQFCSTTSSMCRTDSDCCSNVCLYEQCFDKCLPGFIRDGTSCVDINECTEGLDDCFPLGCVNTPGSFQCMYNLPAPGTIVNGRIEIIYDFAPEETTWTVNDATNGVLGKYSGSGVSEIFTETISMELEVGTNYEAVISDAWGDGFFPGMGSFTISLELADGVFADLGKVVDDYGESATISFMVEDVCESDRIAGSNGSECNAASDCCTGNCFSGTCSFPVLSIRTTGPSRTNNNEDLVTKPVSSETLGSVVPSDMSSFAPSDFNSRQPTL